MQWILDLGGNFIPGAGSAKSAAVGLQAGLVQAEGAASSLNATMRASSPVMRGMYADLAKAESELAHLERTSKKMQSSGSIDFGQWQELQGEIAEARNKVAGLNTEIGNQGGRKFDPKEYDDRVKASEKWFAEEKKKKDTAEKEAAKTAAKEASELTKKSKEETAKRKADKDKADKENAATGATVWQGTKYLAASAAAAGLAVVGAASVAYYAIVTRALQTQVGAQARLNAVQMRFNLGLRDISRNANLTPFLDALDRGAAMFDKNTATGQFMGEQTKRAFDAAGTAVTALVPYGEKAFAKLLVGTVRLETGFYQVVAAGAKIGTSVLSWAGATDTRLSAITKATQGLSFVFGALGSVVSYVGGALGGGVGWAVAAAGIGILSMKAVAGAAALVKWGGALAASNPLLAATAAAVLAVVAAYQQFQELQKTWDDNSWEQIKNQFSGDKDAMSKRQGIKTGDDYDKQYGLGKYAKKGEGQAAGKPVGADIGKGIVVGLKSTTAEVEAAGADLTRAAITGAKKEGEIRSPSGKARREVGKNIGIGTRLGMEDEQQNIENAAKKTLFPDMSGGGSKAAGGRGSGVYVDLRGATFHGTQTQEDIDRMVEIAMVRHLDQSETAEAA